MPGSRLEQIHAAGTRAAANYEARARAQSPSRIGRCWMTSSRQFDIAGLRAEFASLSEAVASRFDRLLANPPGSGGETTGRLAAAASEIRAVHAELGQYLSSPHADPRQEAVVLANLITVQRRTLAMLDAYDAGSASNTAPTARMPTTGPATGAPPAPPAAMRQPAPLRPAAFSDPGPRTAVPQPAPLQAAPPAPPDDERYDAFRNQLAHLLTAYEHRQPTGALPPGMAAAQPAASQTQRIVTHPPARPAQYAADVNTPPTGAWPAAPRAPSTPALPPVMPQSPTPQMMPTMSPPTMPSQRPAAPPLSMPSHAPSGAAPVMSAPTRPAYGANAGAHSGGYPAAGHTAPPPHYAAQNTTNWSGAQPPSTPAASMQPAPPQAAVAVGGVDHDGDMDDETSAPPRRWTPLRMAMLAGLAVVTIGLGTAAVYLAGPRLHRVTALILGGPPSAAKSQQTKPASKLQDRAPTTMATATAPASSAASPSAEGKFVAVIATFQDFSAARQAFVTLKQSFPDLLGTTAPDIETVEVSGSGTWHRLGVLPAMSRNDAQELCNRLQAAGHSGCWVKPQG